MTKEEAIQYFNDEIRLCRAAPSINGCQMTEDWQRTIDACEISVAAIRKVLELEQAEQDGRLVVLPCKVGDMVYKSWYEPCHNGEDYPDSYGCCGCEDECDLKRCIFDFKVPSVDWILSHLNSFGDGVWYLTREKAEAALAGKGGEG